MGNQTSRHLQTLKPLSTFEFCPSVTGHDESVKGHKLLGPLTLQIIMSIMVTKSAVSISLLSSKSEQRVSTNYW